MSEFGLGDFRANQWRNKIKHRQQMVPIVFYLSNNVVVRRGRHCVALAYLTEVKRVRCIAYIVTTNHL